MTQDEHDLGRIFGRRFARALAHSPLPEDALALLGEPARVLRVRVPLRRDDGRQAAYTAWRLQLSAALGPSKGGVRFHPAVDEASLTVLAARILLKCAVNELPHGGAAGGVAVDPKTLSPRELEAVSRGYVDAVADVVGSDRDILSPDVGTDARVMAWMADELDTLRRRHEPAAVNGKPVGRGGVPGRHAATARGAETVLSQVLAAEGLEPRGLTCAVQGLGTAGGTLAARLAARGVTIVAVSDSSGGWYAADGLDVQPLIDAKARRVPLASQRVERATAIAPEAALEVPADIVVAAALGGQVTPRNAPALRCRLLVEIANAAVTDGAEAILEDAGVTIVPDVVVNAGGITVSHFEWASNRHGLAMTESEVVERLESRMSATARRLLTVARDEKVPLTIAAQLSAIHRLRAGASG